MSAILQSRTIFVSRGREAALPLYRPLEAHGATVLGCALLDIRPSPDWLASAESFILKITEVDWIVFTSPNGVSHFLTPIQDHLSHTGAVTSQSDHNSPAQITQLFADVSLCAIGKGTDQALQKFGLAADLIPETATSRSVLETLATRLYPGQRVLLPRGNLADPTLPRELKRHGVALMEIICYETYPPKFLPPLIHRAITAQTIDLFAFTSPSSIHHLFTYFPEIPPHTLVGTQPVACIGPSTRAALATHHLPCAAMPQNPGLDTLAAAIVAYFKNTLNRRHLR